MKLRSRGLGRRELVMDFREYEITRDGDDVVVSGTIREPVTWDFSIRISGEDIPGMLRVGMHRHTLSLAARWMFHTRHKARPTADMAPVRSDAPAHPRRVAARHLPEEKGEPGAVPEEPGPSDTGPAPASITVLCRPASLAVGVPQGPTVQPLAEGGPAPSPIRRTADFGAPRRRGGTADPEPAPAGAVAGGGGG